MAHPRFQVGLKAFLVDGPRLLLVQERIGDRRWELPGGRIDAGEEAADPASILRRELTEELGTEVHFEIGHPSAVWTRPWEGGPPGEFVFLVGHLCRYAGGAIRLSDEHLAHAWVDADSWRAYPLAPGYERALAAFWDQHA